MHRIIVSVFFSIMMNSVFAQSPNLLQYQAIIRNASGQVVANQTVSMRVSLLKSSATGTVVYFETHRDTTTLNGLVTIDIGAGTPVSGSFGSINWGQGPYFIKMETDVTGGTNYMITGTTQLLSVPYSFYANDVKSSLSPAGDTLFIGQRKYFIPGIRDVTSQTTSFACGTSVTFTYRGKVVTYGTVEKNYGGSLGKKCWLDRNLGATRVAISANDHLAYGDLFQWGRSDDGHQVINWSSASSGTYSPVIRTTSNIDKPLHDSWIFNPSPYYDWRVPNNNNLWQGINGINNPCPLGWRVPVDIELLAESTTWSETNTRGAFSSSLKLTLTGGRGGHGNFYSNAPPGSQGGYWTSSIPVLPDKTFDVMAKVFIFNSGSINLSTGGQRHDGFSIRCIKDL
jgi:hypothetical protein